MKCPRCQAENRLSGSRCASCGAPLLIPDDPDPGVFDLDLALDRRSPDEPALELPDFAEADLLEEPERPPGPPAAPTESDETHLTCAPLGRRLVAWAVDGSVLSAAVLGSLILSVLGHRAPDFALVLLPAALGLTGLLGFAYGALALALTGATLGQRLVGLRVAGPDGLRPDLVRSAVRSALAVLGTAALGVGLLPAILTRSGRGLHDHATGTAVVCAS
ncbi:MAG TPA: RDD family protein [Anaeromyxobacteraceae bacterium]|nr:RDD family protein [Anaeromyxobacteraceae bacterium]